VILQGWARVVSVDLARSGAAAQPHGADRWLDAAAATAGCRLDERIIDSTIRFLHVTDGLARRWWAC
jgi:hypothetical protein